MAEIKVRGAGLRFPEGPVALADGSVLVCEVEQGTLTRVTPAGGREVVAECGGGPNGAAAGPDGRIYVANNGGFEWDESPGFLICVACALPITGRIEAVDLATGEAETLYTECGGRPLEAPNDIVFDAVGGFYFTDSGHWRGRVEQSGAIYYAQPDGSGIAAAVDSFPAPNGIGLSPDGRRLYVSSTQAGRLWYFEVESPGVLRGGNTFFAPGEANFLWSPATYALLDSLAIDAEGNVCQANILSGISVISPFGDLLEHVPIDDPFTTNICFGGPDRRTAFVTGAGHGKLFEIEWPRPGLPLNFDLG
jgi:gluconolactonase